MQKTSSESWVTVTVEILHGIEVVVFCSPHFAFILSAGLNSRWFLRYKLLFFRNISNFAIMLQNHEWKDFFVAGLCWGSYRVFYWLAPWPHWQLLKWGVKTVIFFGGEILKICFYTSCGSTVSTRISAAALIKIFHASSVALIWGRHLFKNWKLQGNLFSHKATWSPGNIKTRLTHFINLLSPDWYSPVCLDDHGNKKAGNLVK